MDRTNFLARKVKPVVNGILSPPLRLAILSSSDPKATARARELESILDSTASGISVDVNDLQSPQPGDQPLGEKLELKVFLSAPQQEAGDWLDATLHAMVVVLVDAKLLEDSSTLHWLRACARHLGQHPNRDRLIAVPFGEAEQQRWIEADKELGEYQTLSWMNLDPEPAGRADQLAMRVLHSMIRVLAREVYGGPSWDLRLFLSHARIDGFYLAQSLRHFLSHQSWLDTFYDARDIEPGISWKQALRDAVSQSIMLILRTDTYDRRLWCRQEVHWAETLAVPRIVIDARSRLAHPASELALDMASAVRVPDGNLARALFATLQIALLALLFQRRVTELQRCGSDLDPETLVTELQGGFLRESLLDNGLSPAENQQLLRSTLAEETILLILKGLKHLLQQSRERLQEKMERS